LSSTAVPAIEGWFTVEDRPHLLGRHCPRCGTYAFPPTVSWCPNPACDGEDLETVPLSRRARVWSYTDARYQPPPPYVVTSDPYEPFAIVAAELEDERIVVLGQAAAGVTTEDLKLGQWVELVLETLYQVDGSDHLVWRWRPVAGGAPPDGSERSGR
jgi:uncharacterized OB-fold protein